MAAANHELAKIAQSLPPRLLRFFTKFPPRISPNSVEPPKNVPIELPPTDSAAAADAAAADGSVESMQQPNNRTVLAAHPISDPTYNPFLPWKNPVTGRWRGAMYGLRKQADLCKMARKHGVEALLPWSRKKLAVKVARREQLGVRVRGTGVGQMVKGHVWERQMMWKMEKRREAMQNMPALIKEWKTRGHGKGWKKYPK